MEVGGERWEASVLVYWCVSVFFFFFLPVDAPGPVHQVAELRSLVFGLQKENSHKIYIYIYIFTHLYVRCLDINTNIYLAFIPFFRTKPKLCAL